MPMSTPIPLFMLLMVVSLFLGSVSFAQSPDFDLVVDGHAATTIVLPEQTEFHRWVPAKRQWLRDEFTKRNTDLSEDRLKAQLKRQLATFDKQVEQVGDEELLAANELQSIIEKMTGAKLEVVRSEGATPAAGSAILLGAAFARAAGLSEELDKLDKDGFICRVVEDKLILAGQRARGTLYAVYHLLESFGCRWTMPGPFGELYPSTNTLRTNINTVQNPGHAQRYFWCTYGHGKEYPQWTLRNKGNFVRALGDPRIAQGHGLGQPLKWGAGQEKYKVKKVRSVRERVKGEDGKVTVKTVDKEIWTLPDEYFAMVNGKLNFHTPNLANPKTWDLYADFYIEHFNRNPLEEYASMSAEDGFVKDQRPASMKLQSKEYDFAMGAFSATDALWFFLNRVIERVEKVHPTKKFGVLVYSNNLMPPRLELVNPKMALVIAPLGVSPLHHVRDTRSKTMRAYREWFEDWMILAGASGAETYLYDYEPMGYCWNMAMICPRWAIIGKNYPWFKQLGMTGHTTQGYDDWGSCGLDNYLMQRLYWDPMQDYKAVIEDYCKARFGEAAATMQAYYDVLEARMAEIPDLYSNEVWDNHLILTPEVRAECRKLLEKAVTEAKTERSKAQLQAMVDLQTSTDAACDAVEHARVTANFGEAAAIMGKCFEIRDKLNQHYTHFMHPTRLDEKQKAGFMTGGIYNQYLAAQKRIDAAKAAVPLPRMVKGSLDTRNHAAAKGYHLPETDVSELDDLDTTVCPDVKYGTQREVAAFFYRTDVEVPQAFADGKKYTLYFPSLIARALQIWINGEPVMFDFEDHRSSIWRGPDYFWMNYDHTQAYDITPHLKPGEKNTIAYRVFKSHDFAGTYRRVYLLAEEE